MINFLQFYFRLCFLKVAPQDAPASQFYFYFSIFLYFCVGVGLLVMTEPLLLAVAATVLQIVLFVFFTNLALLLKKAPERFTQTMTALTASGAIMGLLALPIINFINSSGTDTFHFITVLAVLLVIWAVIVVAHVLRHALDVNYITGLGVSLVYMYISFAVTVRVLKLLSMPMG